MWQRRRRKVTREDKKRNKEHCKYMPFDIKLQCWWTRNLDIIAPILSSVVGILIASAIIVLLKL